MMKFFTLLLFVLVGVLPISTTNCLFEPDTEFVKQTDTLTVRDTLTVHDTTHVTKTVTLHDTLKVHDTTQITKTVTVHDTVNIHDTAIIYKDTLFSHDTIRFHDTTTITFRDTIRTTVFVHDTLWKRDTVRIHDTINIATQPKLGSPNLFNIDQYNPYSSSRYMRVWWCKVDSAIGYKVYYTTNVNSTWTLSSGDEFESSKDTVICNKRYFRKSISFYNYGGITTSGTYFFKVVPVDAGGNDGPESNVRAGVYSAP